jgi:hypothetical protein
LTHKKKGQRVEYQKLLWAVRIRGDTVMVLSTAGGKDAAFKQAARRMNGVTIEDVHRATFDDVGRVTMRGLYYAPGDFDGLTVEMAQGLIEGAA